MSDNGRDQFEIPKFEIPKDMRSMAEASRSGTQGVRAIRDQCAGHRRQDRGAQRHDARRRQDLSSKALSYAEKNVQSSLDYAQSLLKAKDLTEVMRLHSEYVQGQMRSLAEQASEMGQAVSRAAMDAVKPKI